MPPGSSDFVTFALELLAPLGRVAARRMFGGHGIYCEGLFIAIVQDDTLWLKADSESSEEFLRAGSQVFTYQRAGREASIGFYSAPEAALESAAAMAPWARLASAAALRSTQRAKKPKTPRPPSVGLRPRRKARTRRDGGS